MFPKETKILIIEDSPSMRKTIKTILGKLGFKHIYEAGDGTNGFTIIETQHMANEPIGLVLCDWWMPKESGLDLLKRVRESNTLSNISFIMVTAEGEKSKILEAIREGVDNYIVKPFSPRDIKTKLAETWARLSQAK
ncbi:MAG: response regulator [Bdellovibrionota bacterium]